jgi:plastocyanin
MRIVAGGIALGALLAPAAAQAATKPVYVGPPPKGELEGVPPVAFDADFYPKRITVAAGDRIEFRLAEFGDVMYVPERTDAPSLAIPDPDAPVTGAKDFAGGDMWFNGQPSIALNPNAIMRTGTTIDGSEFATSGIPLGGVSQPWKVKFPRPGTYTIGSALHPSITMKVIVKRNGADVPSRRDDKRRVAKQIERTKSLAKRLLRFKGPDGNAIQAGSDARGVAAIAFFPEKKTVKVGDTVTFKMSRDSIELHNVHFGPKDYLDPIAQRFLGPAGLDPFVAYRSEAPGQAIVFDGANHGNGYVNTGLLDTDRKSPFPAEEKVTFTKAGTYAFYCAVHGNDMKGEVVVQ